MLPAVKNLKKGQCTEISWFSMKKFTVEWACLKGTADWDLILRVTKQSATCLPTVLTPDMLLRKIVAIGGGCSCTLY